MEKIEELLDQVPLPRMVKIRQHFEAPEIKEIAKAVDDAVAQAGVGERVQKGDQVAIAVGSRGVVELPAIVKAIVTLVESLGAFPFIVPAMGSHGGATAEGQEEVLADLGITEKSVGAPIRSSMEVVQVGKLANGLRIYTDKLAYNADKIIVINRIKAHTAFDGPFESGLMKMITIGLGKRKGADSAHQFGFGHMAKHVQEMAEIVLRKAPIIFGIASIENAYDRPARIVAVPAEKLAEVEPELLLEAKSLMARLLLNPIDVLVVNEIGKDISGSGMDPQITGRYPTPFKKSPTGTRVSRVVVLDLTEKTHGNANGIGYGDVTTKKVFDQISWEKGYFNALTSTVVQAVKIPMFLRTEKLAVQAGIKTCNAFDLSQVRLVRLKNTLDIQDIWISESMLPEAKQQKGIEILSEPEELTF